jgi:hypothetical protein
VAFRRASSASRSNGWKDGTRAAPDAAQVHAGGERRTGHRALGRQHVLEEEVPAGHGGPEVVDRSSDVTSMRNPSTSSTSADARSSSASASGSSPPRVASAGPAHGRHDDHTEDHPQRPLAAPVHRRPPIGRPAAPTRSRRADCRPMRPDDLRHGERRFAGERGGRPGHPPPRVRHRPRAPPHRRLGRGDRRRPLTPCARAARPRGGDTALSGRGDRPSLVRA